MKQFQCRDKALIRVTDHTSSVKRSRRGRDQTSDKFRVHVTSRTKFHNSENHQSSGTFICRQEGKCNFKVDALSSDGNIGPNWMVLNLLHCLRVR